MVDTAHLHLGQAIRSRVTPFERLLGLVAQQGALRQRYVSGHPRDDDPGTVPISVGLGSSYLDFREAGGPRVRALHDRAFRRVVH